jgi:hypothetical protein
MMGVTMAFRKLFAGDLKAFSLPSQPGVDAVESAFYFCSLRG